MRPWVDMDSGTHTDSAGSDEDGRGVDIDSKRYEDLTFGKAML